MEVKVDMKCLKIRWGDGKHGFLYGVYSLWMDVSRKVLRMLWTRVVAVFLLFVVLNVLDDSMPSLAQWWLCERLNHVTFTYVTHTRSSRDVTWLHRPSGDSCRASFQLS